MNSVIFLTVLFLPFLFFLYLLIKRVCLSSVSKNVLNYGLSFCLLISLIASIVNQFIQKDITNIFLIVANSIFILISLLSALYFKYKKQFIFTRIRYEIFLSLFISMTYLFILSNNLLLSTLVWILSGIIIYIFSYFDIFKTGSDYNSNRFYFIFLTGDFCLMLSVLILVKFAIISDNYSYILNFDDIKTLSSYIIGTSDFEYIILFISIIIALFSKAFVLPFSCCFSFLANASNLFYMIIFSTIAPLYSLILFLKLDLFDSLNPYLKIYFICAVVFVFIALLFEKHFKIIFGYLISIVNTLFIIGYFYNTKLAYICTGVLYLLLVSVLFMLFIKEKLSFKRRIININTGFIQEKFIIFVYEKLPVYAASVVEFADKKIIGTVLKFILCILNTIGYHYIRFIQKKEILSIIKGILTVFTLFVLLAIFIALFGNFGEMQS